MGRGKVQFVLCLLRSVFNRGGIYHRIQREHVFELVAVFRVRGVLSQFSSDAVLHFTDQNQMAGVCKRAVFFADIGSRVLAGARVGVGVGRGVFVVLRQAALY